VCKKWSWPVSEVLFGNLVVEGETEEYNETQPQNRRFPVRGSNPISLEYEAGVGSDLIYTAVFYVLVEIYAHLMPTVFPRTHVSPPYQQACI
jgi:hypothetical protein